MISTKLHPYLIAICKANSDKERRKLIKAADPIVIKAICEIIHNLVIGNITKDRKRLRKFKPHVRSILRIHRTRGLEKKRQLLTSQKGGAALPYILPVFAAIAGGLINKILNGDK